MPVFIMELRMCVTHGGLNAVSCCRTASTRDTAMAYSGYGTLRAGSESVQVCGLPARSCWPGRASVSGVGREGGTE